MILNKQTLSVNVHDTLKLIGTTDNEKKFTNSPKEIQLPRGRYILLPHEQISTCLLMVYTECDGRHAPYRKVLKF